MASLEDRISKPENGQTGADPPSSSGGASMISSPPGVSQSWADETAAADLDSRSAATKANAKKEMSSLSNAQTDGAGEVQGGESGIYEPSYEVNVKLSDLQGDEANPLYSIKSFEDLGL